MNRPFRYRALDANGHIVVGSLFAPASRDALRELEARGLTVVELASANASRSRSRVRGRIAPRARIQLLQELATLLAAGVPLGEALPSLEAAYAETVLVGALAHLRRAVDAGASFAEAIEQSGLGLDAPLLALIAAGETAGALPSALADAVEALEYHRNLVEETQSALLYPTILVLTGLASVGGLFAYVVPRFASLLTTRAEIPAYSRAVIEAGLWLRGHGMEFTLAVLGLLAGLASLLGAAGGRALLRELLARLPLVGLWLHEAALARWATLLGQLLEQRVPILKALELAAAALPRMADRARMVRVAAEVRQGRPLSEALAGIGWLTPTQANLLRVGERSGALARMARELGRVATSAARLRLKRLVALIEPAAILLIGAVVGLVMTAVILAIVSVNAVRL